MHKFLIVIEKAGRNYSAYSPDLPGCVATGKTLDETKTRMSEAIQLHLEGLIEEGQSIPPATAVADYIVIPA